MKKLNEFIADKLASFMATMLLFWVLTIIDLAGAVVDPPANVQAWLLWGVSILFQSVALPVLALVSNKQGDRMEKLLCETHDATLGALANIHAMQKELKEMQEDLHAAHRELVTAVGKTLGGDKDGQ